MKLEAYLISGYTLPKTGLGLAVAKPSKILFAENLRRYMALPDTEGKRRRNSELAEAAGVDPATVTNWLKGKICPELGRLSKIADYLNVPVRDLFLDPTDSRTPSYSYEDALKILGDLVNSSRK